MCNCDCPTITSPSEGEAIASQDNVDIVFTPVEGATSYAVFVWEQGDPFPAASATVAEDGSPSYSVNVTGLSVGNDYNAVVLASCECEDNELTSTTGTPVAPWKSGEAGSSAAYYQAPGFGEWATKLIAGPINRVMNKNMRRIITMLEHLRDAEPEAQEVPDHSGEFVLDLNGHALLNLADDSQRTSPAREP